MSAGRATSYTNFYNNNTDASPSTATSKTDDTSKDTPELAADKLKKDALKRRLMRTSRMKKDKKARM